MPKTDERSEVSRRLGGLTHPQPPTAPAEFAPIPPHPPRWNDDSLTPPRRTVRSCESDGWDTDPAEAGHSVDRDEWAPSDRERGGSSGSSTPAWLSEPCGPVSLWHERLVPERFRGTRWDPGPRGAVVLTAVAVAVVVLAALLTFRERPVAQAVPPITVAGESAIADSDAGGGASTTGRAGAPKPAVPRTTAPARVNPPGSGSAAQLPAGSNPPGGALAAPAPVGGSNPPGGGLAAQAPAAEPNSDPEVNGHPANTGEVVVSVIGLVEHGGLRRFPPGARIADALKAATPRPEADLSGLNLAQHLCDGDQLIVGRTGPRPGTQQVGSKVINGTGTPSPASTSPGATRTTGPPQKVNLNTATEAQLDTLPGVGPVTARAILTWRTQHGRFTSIDQLAEIEGIGPARLNRLRPVVTV
ncbi:helix-hairpin-helix domain-containing protein [Nocardia sp. NPDC056100]|uniref:ComEA family DNA-binding protein n=1 Tax=Nocardia sp. NPDC056100 TaxID=3345712 RepID=UPI0035D64825